MGFAASKRHVGKGDSIFVQTERCAERGRLMGGNIGVTRHFAHKPLLFWGLIKAPRAVSSCLVREKEMVRGCEKESQFQS
jgi:hypothetical protein